MTLNAITAVVMTKLPEAGRVKTRLTPALTPDEAARVHETLLKHWVGRLSKMDFANMVICHDPPDAAASFRAIFSDAAKLQFLAQVPGDLGARIAAAAQALLDSDEHLIFFGVDSPDVPEMNIASCCSRLLDMTSENQKRVVVAPTDDGGFWAIGISRGIDVGRLLAEIDWSSGREYSQVCQRAAELGYDASEPPNSRWDDVDRPNDLKKLLERLSRSSAESDAVLYNASIFRAARKTLMTQQQTPPNPNPNHESFLPQSTVLIVDDNPQNLELLQAFLESLPVKIITAIDGIDALAAVEQHRPDLILLDIMMPRMSGFQVCRTLKGDPKTRDIQILMVTALNELGDIEQASECGTDDFVSKPVNKFELLTRVKSLLRVRHLKNELERALTYLNEIETDDEGTPG